MVLRKKDKFSDNPSHKGEADFIVWVDEENYEMPQYRNHRHNFYQVVFVRKGPVRYSVRNQTLHLQTRDFLIMPPGELHSPVSGQQPGSFTAWEIKFHPVPDVRAAFRFSAKYQVVTLGKKNFESLAVLMEAVMREYRTQEFRYASAIRGLLVNIFILLERDRRAETGHAMEPDMAGISLMENRKRSITRYVEEYIGKRYREQIHFGRMARRLNVSLSYFSEIFKAQKKVSPVEYLNAVRLEKARELMKKSELNFTQIAEAVGYRNVQYFSRIFKEKHRITPSKYRRFINENLYRQDKQPQ